MKNLKRKLGGRVGLIAALLLISGTALAASFRYVLTAQTDGTLGMHSFAASGTPSADAIAKVNHAGTAIEYVQGASLDLGHPAHGYVSVTGNPALNDTFAFTCPAAAGGTLLTFTWKNAPVLVTDVQITLGNNNQMAADLATKMGEACLTTAFYNPVGSTYVFMAVKDVPSIQAGVGITLGAVTSQPSVEVDAGDEYAASTSRYVVSGLRYTVLASDVTAGIVYLGTGLASIKWYKLSVETSTTDVSPVLYDGNVTAGGPPGAGFIAASNVGIATPYIAGNVIVVTFGGNY